MRSGTSLHTPARHSDAARSCNTPVSCVPLVRHMMARPARGVVDEHVRRPRGTRPEDERGHEQRDEAETGSHHSDCTPAKPASHAGGSKKRQDRFLGDQLAEPGKIDVPPTHDETDPFPP